MNADKRRIYSWAFYDWANSAFATVVMAGFFPLFFKQYWASALEVTDSTFWLGVANSVSSLVIVLLAPLLGVIADRAGKRKRFLLLFAVQGVAMTAGLALLTQGSWQLAALLYILATLGFMGGNVFYDSLLVDVAPKERLDSVSALGFAVGYLGGGLLFAFCVATTLSPESFGFSDAAEAVRWSFLWVALWWALFSLPIFLWVEERRADATQHVSLLAGFREVCQTLHEVRQMRPLFLFLLGYWLYIDGVDTVVRMAVDYGLSLGFDSNALIIALLITQFVGFPAAILFGRIGERLGTRTGIFIGLGVYLLVTIWGAMMTQSWEFYALAVVIGLVQGGVQALSRSLFVQLIPKDRLDRSAEFFGFYNMVGKFAAVIGPALMGWVGVLTGNPRFGILSLLILFIAGGWLLSRVKVADPL